MYFDFSWLTPYTSCDQFQTEDVNGAHTWIRTTMETLLVELKSFPVIYWSVIGSTCETE